MYVTAYSNSALLCGGSKERCMEGSDYAVIEGTDMHGFVTVGRGKLREAIGIVCQMRFVKCTVM